MFRTLVIVGMIVAVTLALATRFRRSPARGFIFPSGRYPVFGRAIFTAAAAMALGLAATGFYASFVAESALTGLPLLLHVALGGAFIVLLPLLGLLRGEMHATAPGIAAGRKTCFWAFLALGLISGGTILFSMTPLFGGAGMAMLLNLHTIAGALLTMALIGLILGR